MAHDKGLPKLTKIIFAHPCDPRTCFTAFVALFFGSARKARPRSSSWWCRAEMKVLASRPLYLQVRDALVQRITAEEWKPGVSLPNEGDLARELGISPGTVRKALDLLESERLVTRRQGRGTFVNDPASQEEAIRYSHFHSSDGQRVGGVINVTAIEQKPSSDAERERLQLELNAQVYRIDKVRSHGDHVFMVEQVAMPAALFPDLQAREVPTYCAAVIGKAYGVLLGKSTERVSMSRASKSASEALNIPEGSPVMFFDRVILTLEGRPAEWRRAECLLKDLHYRADHH
jgi:GntR family transcriptional regulator